MDSNVKICQQCNQFQSSDRGAMKRHVAIFHAGGAFSTLKCRKCLESFYDGDHLMEHFRTSEMCKMVDDNPLPNHLQLAFESLVDQMMIPLEIPAMSAPDSSAQGGRLISNIRSASPTDLKRIAEIKHIDVIDISDDEEAPEQSSRSDASIEAGSVPAWSICTVNGSSTELMDVKVEESIVRHQMEVTKPDCGQVENIVRHDKYPMEELEDFLKSSNASAFQENDSSGSAKSIIDREKLKRTVGDGDLYHNQIFGPLNRCFGEEGSRSKSRMSAKMTIYKNNSERYPLLLDFIHKYARNGSIRCQLCSNQINIINRKMKRSYEMGTFRAREHIYRHLDRPLFKCQQCGSEKATIAQMTAHMLKHTGKRVRTGALNQTSLFEKEITAMTRACFDYGQQSTVNGHPERDYQFENGCHRMAYSDASQQITGDLSIGVPSSLAQNMELLRANQISLPANDRFGWGSFQCGVCGLQIWNWFLAERHSQIIHGRQME